MKLYTIPCFCLFFLYPCYLLAQDKIYLQTEVKDGKIVDINADKIKYKNPQNPGPVYSLSSNKVLIAFNASGSFLCPSKIDTVNAGKFINNFLTSSTNPQTDKIFTTDKKEIDGQITSEDDASVNITGNSPVNKIDKSNVAVIIYKNGSHKILTAYSQAADVLSNFQNGVAIKNKSAESKNNIIQQANVSSTTPVAKSTAVSSPNSTQPKTIGTASNATTTTSQTPNTNSNGLVDDINGVSFKDFEKKALQKTAELNGYLKILCDKTVDYETSNKAIDQACALFINEDAMVELTSTTKNNVTHYKIRDYLIRIKLIKYDKVEIEWTNIQYVSNLKQGPDGNYYGVVSFEQTFKGYKDNNLVYSDVTRKNIEVILKTYKKSMNGKTVSAWDILLSDIGVIATKNT